jgi:hypothetical protein
VFSIPLYNRRISANYYKVGVHAKTTYALGRTSLSSGSGSISTRIWAFNSDDQSVVAA